ncbi:MAG TPA: hypothetical protein VE621_17630, partial [Bryobacteraceae bacterium]|nr:hypothetical protein [Bryobacteraceae bacterium]
RHEHIGQGRIGLEGFRGLLNHPKLKSKPFILETPYDQEGDDIRNVQALRSLVAPPPAQRRNKAKSDVIVKSTRQNA